MTFPKGSWWFLGGGYCEAFGLAALSRVYRNVCVCSKALTLIEFVIPFKIVIKFR